MTLGKARQIALRTSVIYAIVAGLWILGSDRALVALFGNSPELARYEIYKGWGFVVITALLLYAALRTQLSLHATEAAAKERIEAELAIHRERLRQAAVAGNIGFWDYDLATKEVYFSPEWKEQLGYKDHEIPNRIEEWESRIHPDDLPRIRQAMTEYFKDPVGGYRQEFRMHHRDGSYRWILAQGSVARELDRSPRHMLGSHVDVTVMKLAEIALRERGEADARLAQVAAVVPGAIVAFHQAPDGRHSFSFISTNIQTVFGATSEELAKNAAFIFDRINAEDLTLLRGSIAESANAMTPWRCEFRYAHPINGEIWLEALSLPASLPNGGLRWNGFVMDITQRKRTELRIRQLNRIYAVLSDINQTIVRVREPQALFDAVCRIAVEKGNIRMAWVGRVDATTGKVIPIARAGWVDGYLDSLDIDLHDERRANAPTATAIRTGRHAIVHDIETEPTMLPWRDAALTRGYRSLASIPIRLYGAVVGALNLYSSEKHAFDDREIQLLDEMAVDLSFALEVSDGEAGRLRTEASSRENEERFRQIAENIREVFWLTDPLTHRIVYVNPVYETVWGRPVDSLYANPQQWLDAVHVEDRPRVDAAIKGQPDGSYDQEYRIVRPDGAIRWVRARAFPVKDSTGQIYRVAGLVEDISDRKLLEQQFFRAQRLEAIGTLASGIAHDLNNVLAPIMMCAPMLRMGLPSVEFEKMLGTIEASTRRGADLVRQLLVFGRGVEGGRGPVAPKALVGELLKMAQETFPKNIVVRSDMPDSLWSMVGDATQLHQVLLNLCVNARDAMPDGGVLEVTGENLEMDPRQAFAEPNIRPGTFVRIRVRDTGVGINAEHMGKIFDPFFTTKPPGKGTGLGLSTVLGIVKSHGGFLRLQSEVGRGTAFEIYIPAQRDQAAAEHAGVASATPNGNGELILLVEDESSIRDVVSDILARQNYRVIGAADGVEGETFLKENLDDVALIVTDLDMPRMDGMRLIQAARKLLPTVPIVVCTGLRSGRTHKERSSNLEDLGVETVLAKPFAASELLVAIHSGLARAAEKRKTLPT